MKSVTVSPSICHEADATGPDAIIFVFWMLSFKLTFSLSSFALIKRPFSSSSVSAIMVVLSAYLRLLIFLPAVLIPVSYQELPKLSITRFTANPALLLLILSVLPPLLMLHSTWNSHGCVSLCAQFPKQPTPASSPRVAKSSLRVFLFCALGFCSSDCGEWTKNRRFLKVQYLRSHTKSTKSEFFFKRSPAAFHSLGDLRCISRETTTQKHGEGENTLFYSKWNFHPLQSNPGFPFNPGNMLITTLS